MRIRVILYILYYKVYNSNCYQVGHDLIGYAYYIDVSMPEHETLPSSSKKCLQIVAVTLFVWQRLKSVYQIVSYLTAARVVYLVI